MIVPNLVEAQAKAIELICPLSQAGAVSKVGGKAHNLSLMLNEGFPVFPGFVVTDQAFQEFLSVNQLREPIAALVEQIDYRNLRTLQQTSTEIRRLFQSSSVPEHLADEMFQQWREQLPGRTLIVRSSAVGEDSQQGSFAGQLDSILNVRSEHELLTALLTCWASYWSERSLFYQRERGLPLAGMGVLVQEQAKSAISGVLFTISPDVGRSDSEECMTVEYCRGFGSALVSGEICPGRLIVARSKTPGEQFEKQLQREALTVESSGDADTDAAMLKEEMVSSLVSCGLKLEKRFDGPQDIEWTVDEEGRLFLLQSRSITVFAVSRPAAEGRQAASLRKGKHKVANSVLWSNANVNENFPDPVSPLLFSVASTGYYHYFRNLGMAIGISPARLQAMERPLQQIIGLHGARMYYNLTSIHACLRMAPYGERLTELFNNFVGADRIAATDHHPDWERFGHSRLKQFGEVCHIATKVGWRAMRLSSGVAEFEATVDQFALKTCPELLQQKSLPELLRDLRQFIEIRSHHWTNASLADAAAMLSYGMLKRFLNDQFPDKDLASLHNSLLKGLPNLASNKPVIGLWELSRQIQGHSDLQELFTQHSTEQVWHAIRHQPAFSNFRSAFENYLDESGFRCSGELMLTVPGFQENPVALIEILKAYSALRGESPAERLLEQESQRITQTDQLMKSLARRSWFRFWPWPTSVIQARCLLNWTQRSIALRERARLKQALLYNRLRQIVLAIGNHLVPKGILSERDDIFFLTYPEIDQLLSRISTLEETPASMPNDQSDPAPASEFRAIHESTFELIRRRRSEHRQQSLLQPPDTFELSEGCSYASSDRQQSCAELHSIDGQAESQDSCNLSAQHSTDTTNPDALTAPYLKGIGACGGTITAQAAVLHDVSEFSRLSQGNILVTRQTDPGWGPLFFLIRGLVIERGGMLSHGAILAREYGIPTVVGVVNASQKIAHGQTITVNGDRGIVQISHE
jgi:pyruvate,water dikinase